MQTLGETLAQSCAMLCLATVIALAGCAVATGGSAGDAAKAVPPDRAVKGTAGDAYPWNIPLAKAPLDDAPLTSPRTLWFREGKFGMFIHWGVYAVPAGVYKGKEVKGIGEWIMNRAKIPVEEYEKFPPQFNPTKFDADQWARLAKEAGMTYMVITSKHHDGFCMWPSDVTDYDIADRTPFTRDPMKELAEACRKYGLKFCFYHSIMDWHHPQAKGDDFPEYHQDYLKPQVKELIARYGPLGILWFDGEWIKEWDQDKGRDLYNFCRTLQPSLVVNNRVGKRKDTDGDYETPEQNIPAGAIKGRLWETCMTMNDTWGYKKNDHNWKSDQDLIQKLIDICSKGGNFLLNVGPTAEGLIPEPSVRRLRQVGRWLEHNSESVYGTTQSPWSRHPFNGRCTVKGNTLYVHVFAWDGPVSLPGLKGAVKRVRLVDKRLGEARHAVEKDGETATLVIQPPASPDLVDTVVAVEFEGPVAVEPTAATTAGELVKQAADGRIVLPASKAEIHGNRAKYESGGGKDNIGFWVDERDWVSWAAKVDTPGTFDVDVTYAAASDSGGATYDVYAGEHKVGGKVEATGGWADFKTVRVGQLAIFGEGTATIAVKPVTKPNLAVMNLKSVTLTPAK